MKTTFIIFALIILVLLFPFLTAWLWNIALVPAVSGINEISYWQAIGLTILGTILFKDNNYRK